jgi:hypothetical protein
VAQVKAIACELPRDLGVPLSRFSRAELHRLVIERAVCDASASTIARWLSEDAIRPWQHRSWIFPRDPRFLEKAGPVLDLYERRWHRASAGRGRPRDELRSCRICRPARRRQSRRQQQALQVPLPLATSSYFPRINRSAKHRVETRNGRARGRGSPCKSAPGVESGGGLSRAGFDGDLEARILSSREETLRRHGPSEEVPARTA